MKITIKNLQQQTFTVDIGVDSTVLELKELIYSVRGSEYIVEKQKLIYAGVILDDNRTIASYSVDEKKFIVVMLKRDLGGVAQKSKDESCGGNLTARANTSASNINDAKTESKDSSNRKSDEQSKSLVSEASDSPHAVSTAGLESRTIGSSAPGSSTYGHSAVGSSIDTAESETSKSTHSSGNAGGALPTALQSQAESSLLMGDEYNRTVESIVEMGYCREMVQRAMAASFNNPERAVEYLISGIPENEDGFNVADADAQLRGSAEGRPAADIVASQAPESESTNTVPVAENRSAASSTDASPRIAGDPFEFLRNQPQFLQMRSLVYQNPDLLHAVLQQIGQTNPALLQLISENQDAFLSMLNQPLEGSNTSSSFANRRMTPGRRSQLASIGSIAGGGDGFHVQTGERDPRAGGDGPEPQRPGGGGDAGSDTISHDSQRSDRNADRRAAVTNAFLRERAATAAAVEALTAAASAAHERAAVPSGRGSDNPIDEDASLNMRTDDHEVTNLHLTQQDRIAIERLKAMGFPEVLVLQAYFACGKDEQLAANFLISSSFDD